MNKAIHAAILCLLAVICATPTDSPAVTKCVDRDGHVTYSDAPCPGDRKQAIIDGPSGNLTEEILCAAAWMRDESEFENELGLVPIGDQIIFNGEPMDMIKAYKRSAQSAFNFGKCTKYNYRRPVSLRDFSIDRWTAWMSVCKLVDRKTHDSVIQSIRKVDPEFRVGSALQGDCAHFRSAYPSPAVLETEIRNTHHPLPGEEHLMDPKVKAKRDADLQEAIERARKVPAEIRGKQVQDGEKRSPGSSRIR